MARGKKCKHCWHDVYVDEGTVKQCSMACSNRLEEWMGKYENYYTICCKCGKEKP